MAYKTEQETFWAGKFGTDYIERNQGRRLLSSNVAFFGKALQSTYRLSSCIEFGANIGMNLRAINILYPEIVSHAIEINAAAAEQLSNVIDIENVYNRSLLDFMPDRQWDIVLIKGVLIHINPNELDKVYKTLVNSCGRYILVAEYYNPTPTSLSYRGHVDRLFKRDFAGEIMDQHPQMRLLDYGFSYHRDPNFPQDDVTWFLMEKTTK